MLKKATPYVSGEDDARQGDACAACGQGMIQAPANTRVMERHGGRRMMLCIDFRGCNRRSGVIKR